MHLQQIRDRFFGIFMAGLGVSMAFEHLDDRGINRPVLPSKWGGKCMSIY